MLLNADLLQLLLGFALKEQLFKDF